MKTPFLRYKTTSLFLCLLFADAAPFLTAQNAPPPITPVSSVAVPSVQPITSSPSFASPSIPNFPVPPQPQTQAAQQQQQTETQSPTKTSATPPKNAVNPQAITAASLSGLAASLFGSGQNNNLMSTLLGNTGVNPGANVALEQILAKLEQIQAGLQNPELSAAVAGAAQQQAVPPPKKNGQILRFTVNNYSVLDTCRTIFFSQRGKDGNFLLTGDRKYLSDGKVRDETFYLFFKKTGLTDYEVACSVSQDYENKYSFLYQLAQRPGITARQTGNFITVRIDEPGWKLDFLVDIADQETF